MADIIRGGEASLQLPNRGSVWGDANTPDPTGELIKNIKERKKDFKDFYNSQKEEVDALNDSLKGMQGRDFADMQNKIVDTRNQIAKLYSTATPKNYNSPDFQSKLYQIKDEFVQMKNSLDTSAADLAKATEFAKTAPHVARQELMNDINEQANLPFSQRKKNFVNEASNDPKYYNGSAAVDDAIAKLGKSGTHVFSKQDGYLNRTYQKDYNTALYKKDENGQLVYSPAPELFDVLLQDQRMVNQVMNWMTPEAAKSLTEQSESEKEKSMRFHLGEFIKEKHNLEQRFEPTVKEIRIDERSQPSASSKVEQDMNAGARAMLENIKRKDYQSAFMNITVNKGEDGYYKFEPVYQVPGDESSPVISVRAYSRFAKKKLTFEEEMEAMDSADGLKTYYHLETNTFPIHDFASAKNILLKASPYTEGRKISTESVSAAPETKEVKHKIKGKEYSQAQIEKAAKASGVTVEQYLKAINK